MIAYQILTEVREWLLATGNYGISCWIKKLAKSSLRKLNKDEDVSTEVLSKISAALDCDVQDIVDFFPEPKNDVQNKS